MGQGSSAYSIVSCCAPPWNCILATALLATQTGQKRGVWLHVRFERCEPEFKRAPVIFGFSTFELPKIGENFSCNMKCLKIHFLEHFSEFFPRLMSVLFLLL